MPYHRPKIIKQADVTNLVSRLRVAIQNKPRGHRNSQGPDGKFLAYRQTLTDLIKYERIALNYYRGDEVRGYAERVRTHSIEK